MSGHSKWANIRVKKTAQDARRGKVFTRHAKLIEIAVQEGGGGNPDTNSRLKTAVENARAENVPNANIGRAIRKGMGELKGKRMENVTYAGYGPGNVVLLIECLTDNKNRTLNNVRAVIERRGGKLAETGSVMYMFDRKGVVIGRGNVSEDFELSLMDAGVEDIDVFDGMTSVTTSAENWSTVRDVFKDNGFQVKEAGLKYVAKQDVHVTDAGTAKNIMELIGILEEDEDVSEVSTNANVGDFP